MCSEKKMEVLDAHAYATLVAHEIERWSEEAVQIPQKQLGGMPACPFARAAWARDEVAIHVLWDVEMVTALKAVINPSSEVVHVCAWLGYEDMSCEDFDAWIEEQNKNHFGVWIMGFHPDAEVNPIAPEFEGIVDEEYAIVLIQSLEHLVKASNKLRETKYYNSFDQKDLDYVNQRKEIYDAWNEKICTQKAIIQEAEEEVEAIQ